MRTSRRSDGASASADGDCGLRLRRSGGVSPSQCVDNLVPVEADDLLAEPVRAQLAALDPAEDGLRVDAQSRCDDVVR